MDYTNKKTYKKHYSAKEILDAIDGKFDDDFEEKHNEELTNEEMLQYNKLQSLIAEIDKETDSKKKEILIKQKEHLEETIEANRLTEQFNVKNYSPEDFKVHTNELNNIHNIELNSKSKGEDFIFEALNEEAKNIYNDEISYLTGHSFALYFNAFCNISSQKNIYWQFCNLKIYHDSFQQRQDDFLVLHPFADEKDFIESEINGLGIENISFNLSDERKVELKNYLPDYFYKNLIFLQKRKLEYLSSKLNKNSSNIIIESDNPYQRIFNNASHYKLFQDFIESIKKNELAYCSFIYRIMHKDGFIYEFAKEPEFRNFLNSPPFGYNFEKLKIIENCTTVEKVNFYKSLKIKHNL